MMLCGYVANRAGQAVLAAPDELIVAAETMFVALALTTVVGWIAIVTTLRAKVKVWLHPGVRRACAGDFSRMRYVAPTLTGFNRAFLVITTSLVMPIIAISCVVLANPQMVRNPNDAINGIVAAVLFLGPFLTIPVISLVCSRISARHPQECWPPWSLPAAWTIATLS